jgi:hypothetical protein
MRGVRREKIEKEEVRQRKGGERRKRSERGEE